MKINILKGMLTAALAVSAVACSKDYLNTAPEDQAAPDVIFTKVEDVDLAVNGLCRMMTTQYLSSQGFNGEGTIKTWYGNYPGNDFQKCNLVGWADIINSTYNERSTSSYDYYPWYYYYKIITNANWILTNVDGAEGLEEDKSFLKGQALVFRAYSYFMLSQIYCRRYAETGQKELGIGLPIRLDISTGDLEISDITDVYARVYKDLDDAIAFFGSTSRTRDSFYKPDVSVAHAVYARAALTREDWETAAAHAAAARTGYALMSNDNYKAGFNSPNSEWIWGVYEAEDQTLYYYSFFAYQGSNSNATICRTYPCAISRELLDQIPAGDIRKELYLEPTAAEFAECNAAGRSTRALYSRAFKDYGTYLYPTSLVYAYMQFKFRAAFMPGGGSFNLFRSAEMILTEAEADWHIPGKAADAQALLEELNQPRNPGYTCTKTGDDLLAEIKLYRRFELWGEGFDWFDYKRWGDDIVRKSYAAGGSFHQTFAVTNRPTDSNYRTWVIPNREKDYNKAIK